MSEDHRLNLQTASPHTQGWQIVVIAFVLMCGVLQTGCASSKTSNSDMGREQSGARQQGDESQLSELVADGDVNDPTAGALHELAGKLLLYKAVHRKLPVNLADASGGPDSGASTWAKHLLDPLSDQPFIYAPDSKRHAQLPGRIIIYQPVSQGNIGRWALLFDDQAKDGNVVTYVQRVPESTLPARKNTTRIER